jgi:hypothetical protein
MTTLQQRGLAPVRSVLDNGVRVIAKHSGATPAVTVHASFGAGTVFDPPHEPGVAHFVSRTIDRGTASHTAEEIAERLDYRGVALAITVNRHALSLVCTCLVEDLDQILDTIADIVMHPAFSDREVETRRGEIVTMIRQDEDNPRRWPRRDCLSLLYGPDASVRPPSTRNRRDRRTDQPLVAAGIPRSAVYSRFVIARHGWRPRCATRLSNPPVERSRGGRRRQLRRRSFRRSSLRVSVGFASSR